MKFIRNNKVPLAVLCFWTIVAAWALTAQVPSFNSWGTVNKNAELVDSKYRVISSSWAYTKITSNASTQVKSTPGTVHGILVSGPGSAWTIQVFDNTACSGTAIFGATAVTVPAAGTFIPIDADFNTGLCIITAGTTAGELTILSR